MNTNILTSLLYDIKKYEYVVITLENGKIRKFIKKKQFMASLMNLFGLYRPCVLIVGKENKANLKKYNELFFICKFYKYSIYNKMDN